MLCEVFWQCMGAVAAIAAKFKALRGVLDERARRLWAASEARAWGYGGVSAVARATGLARATIAAGLGELMEGAKAPGGAERGARPLRIPRVGGGRKRVTAHDPGLVRALEKLVDPATRGDPQSPLRWTCKSVRSLACELTRAGHPVSHQTVRLL